MDIFTLSMDIGEQILKCGGEIHRAKDTIKRINLAYGKSCCVFALPTIIIAQCDNRIEMRKIEYEETDLAELERLNALSRKLCDKKSYDVNATVKKLYSFKTDVISVFISTFSFTIFFSGSFIDGVFSGIIGIVITFLPYKNIGLPIFSSNLIDSFIAGILSQIPTKLGINSSYDKIIIGTIMLLVPGLTVVRSMRDMMNGDLTAGVFELFSAIMSALAIALGIAGALLLFKII